MEGQISKKTVIGVLEQKFFFASNEITSITPPNDVTQQNAENSVHEVQVVQSFEKDRKEVAFIDATVKDYQTLIDGVDEGVEIYLVSSLAEISAVLETQKDIDAIHILSHGNTGEIAVGNDVLNRDTLGNNAPLLEAMKNSLSQDGDILLYACNVASDGNGQAFVNEIATITQADIAASDDLTGNSALSGDWELETNSGSIDTTALNLVDYDSTFMANQVFNWSTNIYVRPNSTSYAWTWGTGSATDASSNWFTGQITSVSFFNVVGFSWYLDRGHLEYSSNSGSSWTTYNVTDTSSGDYISTTNTLWRFVDNQTNTTSDKIGFSYNVQGGSGSVGTSGIEFLVDSAPTDITSSNTTGLLVSDTPLGLEITTLTPVDTGLTTFGKWVIDSQSNLGLFSLQSDTTSGNTAKLLLNSSLSSLSEGDQVSVVTHYYDAYQTDSSGNPITGEGITKTLTFTVKGASYDLDFSNDIAVNDLTSDTIDQAQPSITTLSNGNFVVTWADTTNGGIYSQVYDHTGAALGTQLTIDSGSSSTQPIITALSNGNFVVAYVNNTTYDIFYKVVNASNGAIVSSGVVESYSDDGNGTQTGGWDGFSSIGLSSDSSGMHFNVTWNLGDYITVKSATFTDNGGIVSAPTIMSTIGYSPSSSVLSNGDIVTINIDGNAWAGFNISIGDTIVGQTVGDTSEAVGVASFLNGGFVVTWSNASGTGIYTQTFDNTGTATSSIIQVNTQGTALYSPKVSTLSNGGFTIVWSSDGLDGSGTSIQGRRFNADGTAIDNSEFQVNEYCYGSQNYQVITALENGAFAVAWVDASSGKTTGSDIEARVLLITAGPTVTAVTASYADTTANDTFSNTTGTISATASSGSISGYGINTGTNGSTVIGAVTYDVSKAGTYGTLYVNSTSGAYVYVPTSDSALNATSTTLTETFMLEATDSAGTSGNTLTITINGVNDAPTLSAPSSASYTDTSANDTFANTTGTLSASDRDSGTTLSYGISTGTNGSTLIDTVTYTVSKAGTYGTLYVKSSDGSYVYVPNASAINALSSNATDTFTVSTSDGSLSNTQTFTVNITGVNDTPTAQDKTITLNEDIPTVLSASDFGFSDVDSGSALSSVKITSLASDGALEYDNGTAWIVVTLNQVITSADIGAGKLRFNPSENENGVSYATFNFTVSDGALESSAKTITYNVTAINDAPVVANALSNQNANVDSIFSFVIPANTFLDVDGNILTYTAQLSGGGAVPAWLSFDAGTGTFGGTPASGDVGAVSVEVIATDNGTGTLSVVDTFDIIVNSGPSVSSISREAGTNATTNTNTLNFTVVFSEAVTGVDASDFTLTTTGTATGTIGSPISSDGGTTWTVPVASIVGDGALGLNLNSAGTGIQNGSNVAIASGFTGQTYTIDNTAPTLSISALALLSDTGTITDDFITSTASQTISATLGASLNGGEVLYGSLDGGTVWVDITSKVSGTALTWNGVTLPVSGAITFKLTDSVGNDSTSTGTQTYQYDANAPTDIASSVTAINTLSATATTTIATLSATDITPSDSFTYTLVSGSGDSDNTKFQINGNQLKVGATALNDGTYSVRVQVTDTAGHSYEKVLSLTASTPTPEPTPPTTTIDGATVQTGTTTETRTTTDTNGNTVTTTVSTEQLVIAPVSDTRTDSTGASATADIPLFWGESSRTEWATTASLPIGIGLTTSGSRAPTTTATQQSALADLLYYIDTTTPSTDSGKTELLGGGESFLNALDNIETLVVNKVTLTSATTIASTTPITITGTANTITTTGGAQAPVEALVIDASALPAGTILNLENVEFAVIVGDGITVRGGNGANIFFAGSGAQDIMLGADDDELYAGDGDDTVGSAGGNDKVFGESGNDTVFGGEGNDTLHGGSGTDKATYTGNMAEYTITRDEGYTYVALVSNPTEVDTLINAETIQFADTNYTVATTINQAQIATLYTQILDRQAEMGGFQYWAHSGNELGGMVVSFIQSNEYKTTSGTNWDTMSNEQKIEELYAAVLGRVADAEGQTYWLNDIAQGASLLNIAEGFVDSLELSGLYQENTDWNFTL